MDKLFKWVQSLPKSVQILLAIVLVFLLGFLVVRYGFNIKPSAQEETHEQRNIIIDFPDAPEEKVSTAGRLDEISRMASQMNRSNNAANDYWERLGAKNGKEEEGVGGLLADDNGSVSNAGTVSKENLDPTVYSEQEIFYITHNIYSKAEIDARHEAARREGEERERKAVAVQKKSEAEIAAERDSIYFARLEKTMSIVNKTSLPQDAAAPAEQVPAEENLEPEPRKIDLADHSIPSATLLGDDIISSLEDNSLIGGTNELNGEIITVPAKATFLKSETLVSGQRVIMRLLQDLRLSDGTLIPANTHVPGICTVGSRLKIEIKTINYGGKIYYTNITVYDNDGTEGIYCPIVATKESKKAADRVSSSTASRVGSIANRIFATNPYANVIGGVATAGISEISRMINSEGQVTVAVTAGYEFYMFENRDKDNG